MRIREIFYNKYKAIAYHEAGHIVTAYIFDNICEKAEILKNGSAKSSISTTHDPEIKCAILVSGFIAGNKYMYGKRYSGQFDTSGSSNDLNLANQIAINNNIDLKKIIDSINYTFEIQNYWRQLKKISRLLFKNNVIYKEEIEFIIDKYKGNLTN